MTRGHDILKGWLEKLIVLLSQFVRFSAQKSLHNDKTQNSGRGLFFSLDTNLGGKNLSRSVICSSAASLNPLICLIIPYWTWAKRLNKISG